MKVTSQHHNYDRQDGEDSFDFKSLILKYLAAWPWFLYSIGGALLLAFAVNQLTPPEYKIQSKFLIREDDKGMELFNTEAAKDIPPPKGQKLANGSIIIKSRSLAESALDRLNFDVEYYEEGLLSDAEIYRNAPLQVEVDWSHPQLTNGKMKITWDDHSFYQLELQDKEFTQYAPGESMPVIVEPASLPAKKYPFGHWIDFPEGRLKVNLKSIEESGSLIIRLRDRESLILQYTGDDLQVVPADKISSILLLTLDTREPYKGSEYLNTLMQVFLENELDEKNTMARNTVRFIDSQLSGISDSLSHSETKLERYRSRNQTYNITTEGNTLFEKLSELEKSLSQEKFRLEYYKSLQEYIQRQHYSSVAVPSGLGIEDVVLNKLVEDLVMLLGEKSRFLAGQTENSPAVVEVSRKIAALNVAIQEALKNNIRSTNLLIGDLNSRIAKIQEQFGRLPRTEQDILNIKRKYSLNDNIYTYLLQRKAEASITLASNMPLNDIVEAAVPGVPPMMLRPMLNYFLAFMMGLIIPVAFIAVRETFSGKIRDLKEIEGKLVVPIVGSIGKKENGYWQMVVANHPKARISEAFRALRTNIDFIKPAEAPLTILVTSSIAGEGKSFCALNLASAFAACGKKTLVIICDMHKSFDSPGLELDNGPGLSDVLIGRTADVPAVIQRTGYKNLDIVVPGPVPPNPAELLIGERFQAMLDDLKNTYYVIVLDSSPVGLTNETLYLTRLASLTLFVLRQNYSDKDFVDDINALREKKRIENLYAVINDVEGRYLSYHRYGHGYYDDAPGKDSFLRKVGRFVSNKAAI